MRLVAKATRKATVFGREFEKRLKIRGSNENFIPGIKNHEYNVARRVTERIQIEQIDRATARVTEQLLTRNKHTHYFIFPSFIEI